MPIQIQIPPEEIADFCVRHHIRRMSLFGSVVRDDFRPESDIDVLVEFEDGRTPGLEFFAMEDQLSRILGKRVDLNTPGGLHRFIRKSVLEDAQVIYDQAG